MSKFYIDNRVMVSGKKSKIHTDNAFNLQSYILTTIFGSATSSTPLTFTNGLTQSASNVATLGGALTTNTSITSSAFTFGITGAGSKTLTANNGTISAGLSLTTGSGNVLSYTTDGVTVARISMVPDIGNGTVGIKLTSSVPTYADEAAAVVAGLTTGSLYKTALGALMIKL